MPRAPEQRSTDGPNIEARPDDLYQGALSATIALGWAGEIIGPLRRVLLGAGVVQAVLVAGGELSQDAGGHPDVSWVLKIIRRGGPPSLAAIVAPFLTGGTWRLTAPSLPSALLVAVELGTDHPILHDSAYALPVIPEALDGRRQPISLVDRRDFTGLATSGIRQTPDLAWLQLHADAALGGLALGVRSDGSTYVLLAECPPVTIDLLGRAGFIITHDLRVHRFVVRPVRPGDPALVDTEVVVPLRRYPAAPRSPALEMSDALALASGFDLGPTEIETIRAVAVAEGAIRASLAYVERRFMVGVDHRQTLFESRRPTLLFADRAEGMDQLWEAAQIDYRMSRARQLEAVLAGLLGQRAPGVAITNVHDPLLDAKGYAVRLV